MIDFLAWMFATPDAQLDPYAWGSALLAHFTVGIALVAAVGGLSALLDRYADVPKLTVWESAALVIAAYSLAWEGGQMLLSGSTLADSFVDALAVACGATVAAGAWRQRGVAVSAALAVMVLVGAKGVRDRR